MSIQPPVDGLLPARRVAEAQPEDLAVGQPHEQALRTVGGRPARCGAAEWPAGSVPREVPSRQLQPVRVERRARGNQSAGCWKANRLVISFSVESASAIAPKRSRASETVLSSAYRPRATAANEFAINPRADATWCSIAAKCRKKRGGRSLRSRKHEKISSVPYMRESRL